MGAGRTSLQILALIEANPSPTKIIGFLQAFPDFQVPTAPAKSFLMSETLGTWG